jgi:hypothetical protein
MYFSFIIPTHCIAHVAFVCILLALNLKLFEAGDLAVSSKLQNVLSDTADCIAAINFLCDQNLC